MYHSDDGDGDPWDTSGTKGEYPQRVWTQSPSFRMLLDDNLFEFPAAEIISLEKEMLASNQQKTVLTFHGDSEYVQFFVVRRKVRSEQKSDDDDYYYFNGNASQGNGPILFCLLGKAEMTGIKKWNKKI